MNEDPGSAGTPLERAFRSHVKEGSSFGLEEQILVIPGEETGLPKERPKSLYATVLLITDTRTSYPSYRRIEGTVQVELCRRASFSVQWIYGGAVEAAKRFDLWAASPYGLFQERDAFINYHDDEDTRHQEGFRIVWPVPYRVIKGVVDKRYEERVVADILVDYLDVSTYDIPDIGEIGEGDICYDDLTERVTIPAY